MRVSGKHWDPSLREEVIRRLSVPGVSISQVARDMGLRKQSVAEQARRMREQPKQTVTKETRVSQPFSVPPLPSSDLPLDELIARRRDESRRVLEADAARDLIPITVNTSGPVGLMVFGDPHIDDPGCDFALLEKHLALANSRQDYLFAGNVADLHNNWTGRLQRLYASQSTTQRDAWRLVEWMVRQVKWLYLHDGNHDVWTGAGDPLNWICRGAVAVREPHALRLALKHPCGAETRLHSRHNFKGNSQYNGLHGMARELAFGYRDHIMVCGHLHFGEDAGSVNADGFVTQMVRVSGYKVVDDYAKAGGFKSKRIHPAALLIVDPAKADNDRSRVWCAPSVEEGIEYLDWKRARYEGTARVVVKAVKQSTPRRTFE